MKLRQNRTDRHRQTDRRQTGGRTIAYSERERELTFTDDKIKIKSVTISKILGKTDTFYTCFDTLPIISLAIVM